MTKSLPNRREFLAEAGLATAAVLCSRAVAGAAAEPGDPLHVAINQWSVGTVRRRDKQAANIAFDDELAGLAAAGVNGLEPGLGSADQVDALAGSSPSTSSSCVRSIPASPGRRRCGRQGTGTDRRPRQACQGGGNEDHRDQSQSAPNRQGKSDEQLRTQAAALNKLGHELAALGITLAYHNHDVELQYAAREFHHMMLGTDPDALSLCLDAHWVYRGAGHSQVALFDVLKLYGSRVSELHLRQSTGNVWSETFGDGDIDYRALAGKLLEAGVRPLLVLEQGPEGETPQTLDTAEVHRRSVHYVREVFADFAKG